MCFGCVRDVDTGRYQLQGGIHRYQDAYGSSGFYLGKNFVFDRRFAISTGDSAKGNAALTSPSPSESMMDTSTKPNAKTNNATSNSKAEAIASPKPEQGSRTEPQRVLGQCLGCHTAWDQYDKRWTCSKCRVMVLLCSSCTQLRLRNTGAGATKRKRSKPLAKVRKTKGNKYTTATPNPHSNTNPKVAATATTQSAPMTPLVCSLCTELASRANRAIHESSLNPNSDAGVDR